jgi:ribonuclease HI
MNPIIIFTDGSSKNNGKMISKGGIGIFFSNKEKKNISIETKEALSTFKITCPKVTNNISELTAILFALKMVLPELKLKRNILIKTDSNYSLKSLTIWYKNWEKNDWKTANKKPISNILIIQKLVNEYIKVFPSQIKFEHVPAHTKEPNINSKEYLNWYGNFQADLLSNIF